MKETLARTFVRDSAYGLLRDWIIEGKLAPSQKLRDKELAEQLGVSRTPIREALLKLEEEGLVLTKPNSSTIVAPLEFQKAEKLYSIVWTLEGLALTQAFESIKDEHIALMESANEKMVEALRASISLEAIQADNAFHDTYIKLADNEDLSQIIVLAKQKINRLKIFYFHEIVDPISSYNEHKLIIKALKKRDLKAALSAVESNWRKLYTY